MNSIRNLLVWPARVVLALLFILSSAGDCAPRPSSRVDAVVSGSTQPSPAALDLTASRAAPLRGPQPFLVILCKFADLPYEPAPPAHFRDLLFGSAPSLDDYWREVSYGNISLAGSEVTGWRDLPKRSDDYVAPDGGPALRELAVDCMSTALDRITARTYAGLALVFNFGLNGRVYAGQACVPAAQTEVCANVMWIWRGWADNMPAWAHEMGHVFGLDHSADVAGTVYADSWDVMGKISQCECATGRGPVAQHPSAIQKDRLGWIAEARKRRVEAGESATLELVGLAEAVDAGYAMATIGDAAATGYQYIVEARTLTGCDCGLPARAVIIHRIEPESDAHPIHLVPHPGDERDTPAASAWLPGSIFYDPRAEVAIAVAAETSSGFLVTLASGPRARALSASSNRAAKASPLDIASLPLPAGVVGLNLANGPRGPVAALWARHDEEGSPFEILVSELNAGGWTEFAPQAHPLAKTAVARPEMAVTGSGAVHAAWCDVDTTTGSSSGPPQQVLDVWATEMGAGAAWSTPVRLNNRAEFVGAAISPALAASGENVYAAWLETRAGDTEVRFAERAGSQRWTPAAPISDAGRRAFRATPALAADEDGAVTAIWVEIDPARDELWEAYRPDTGAWQPNRQIRSSTSRLLTSPRLLADGRGNLFAVWTEYGMCAGGNDQFATIELAWRPPEGEWRMAPSLAKGVDGGKKVTPSITGDGAGGVFVAWTAYDQGKIWLYAVSYRPGAGPSSPAKIAPTGAEDLEPPALATDAEGRVHLAWLSGRDAGRRLNAIILPTAPR